MLHAFCKILLRILLKVFFWRETFGRENFPEGATLITCNHQSYLDPPVVGSSAPEKPVYVARRSLTSTRIIKWLFVKWNTIPITPGEPDLDAVKTIFRRLESGEKVLLFPEGKRSQDGKLQPLKRGFAMIVARSGVPVIPTWVYGTHNAMPKGRSLILPAKIIVAFGKPIYFNEIIEGTGNKKELYSKIIEVVMERMKELREFCLSKL